MFNIEIFHKKFYSGGVSWTGISELSWGRSNPERRVGRYRRVAPSCWEWGFTGHIMDEV